jgi:four helix bundle protein
LAEHTPIEQMEFFYRFAAIADWAWHTVQEWSPLARDTVSKQLIRAADSVGANLVEGDGRYTVADGLNFFIIARASARETRYWIQLAVDRHLVPEEEGATQIAALSSATQLLNRLIKYRRERKTFQAREEAMPYTVQEEDVFAQIL